MWECWTIKKAEHQRIDAFELWCWRRLLRVPWTARRSNQSILKEISPEYHWKDWCWSWSSSTLATWCEELTHLKRPWCWERLKAKGEGGSRGWEDNITDSRENKILKEMGLPDHLTCLLRNLYVGQEATVKTGHGTAMDNECEFEHTLGDSGGQRCLVCYSPWGCRESDMT